MWSAQQQSMLNAMGYTLYVRPQTLPTQATVELAATMITSTSASVKPSLDSVLFVAIMKVVKGRDISQLDIDVDALRSSPHAKRALWPQLRKLMKP